MKKIYLFGDGGHVLSCIDVIKKQKKFKIKGIFSKKPVIRDYQRFYEIFLFILHKLLIL